MQSKKRAPRWRVSLISLLTLCFFWGLARSGFWVNSITAKAECVYEFDATTTDSAWLSDTEFLTTSGLLGDQPHFYTRHTLNGSVSEVAAPTSLRYAAQNHYLRRALSPNGKWLVYETYEGIVTCRVDASECKRIPKRSGRSNQDRLVWSTDSASWFELNFDDHVNNAYTVIRHEAGTNRILAGYTASPSNAGVYVLPEFCDRAGSLIGFGSLIQAGKDLHLVCSMQALNAKTPLNYSVRLPSQTISIVESTMSPVSDEVAISVLGKEPPQLVDKIWHFYSRKPLSPRKYTALYTCRVDGSGLRELGREYVGPNEPLFANVQWTPSGKYISWVWNAKIWRLPVDRT